MYTDTRVTLLKFQTRTYFFLVRNIYVFEKIVELTRSRFCTQICLVLIKQFTFDCFAVNTFIYTDTRVTLRTYSFNLLKIA